MNTKDMFPIPKGKTIYIELVSTEDTNFHECEMLCKIFGDKLRIDKFECQAIKFNGTLEDKIKRDVHSKLTKYLLDEKMLDTNMLESMAYNGGGIA